MVRHQKTSDKRNFSICILSSQSVKATHCLKKNIIIFPDGVSELLLEGVLNGFLDGDAADEVLLYFCTRSPIGDSEPSFWLGGEEIRKEIIAYYSDLFAKVGVNLQVVYEACCDFVSEEELGWSEAV